MNDSFQLPPNTGRLSFFSTPEAPVWYVRGLKKICGEYAVCAFQKGLCCSFPTVKLEKRVN